MSLQFYDTDQIIKNIDTILQDEHPEGKNVISIWMASLTQLGVDENKKKRDVNEEEDVIAQLFSIHIKALQITAPAWVEVGQKIYLKRLSDIFHQLIDNPELVYKVVDTIDKLS